MYQAGYLYRLFHTLGYFRQSNLHTYAQVATSDTCCCGRTSTGTRTSAHIAEYIAEMAENIVDIHVLIARIATAETTEAATLACSAAVHSGMAELIVTGALVRIRQHVVSFRSFFELFLGRLVARIFIRMILHGKFPVSFFQHIGRSVFRHAQHFVIIPFHLFFSSV